MVLIILNRNDVFLDYQMIDVDYNKPIIFQMTQFRMDALLFGCVLRLLEPVLFNMMKWRVALSLLLGLISLNLFYSIFNHPIYQPDFDVFLIAYLGVGAFFCASYFGLFKFIFKNHLICYLGRCSYALYLWHYVLLFIVVPFKDEIGLAKAIIIYLVVVLITGIVSTCFVEKFFLKVRDNITGC